MAEEIKENTFAQMEQENENKPVANTEAQPNVGGELSLDDFSNTAVGEKVKYNRPDLDNKEDVIEKLQVFMPNINEEEPKVSQDQKTKYWPVTVLLTYSSKNEDGVNNREYLSGSKVFQQRDGSASDVQFWYNGAANQVAQLWEKVADAKEISADELSPREFVAFLNNKPKVQISATQFKNFGSTNGPAMISKNMVGKFL